MVLTASLLTESKKLTGLKQMAASLSDPMPDCVDIGKVLVSNKINFITFCHGSQENQSPKAHMEQDVSFINS